MTLRPEKLSLPEQPASPVPVRVVGIGASAGGLEAVTELVRALPPTPGMAFVLVQHLDPNHPSLLTQILGREANMQVVEAADELAVEADRLYVIPPNTNLAVRDGRLRLTPRAETVGPFMPIDHFFRSLAEEVGSLSAAVILSGGGTDGALGLAEVKAQEGVTFAQDDKTARHDSMPRSAIGTGAVDFILPPADIARELVRVVRELRDDTIETELGEAAALRTIFGLIRMATGVDFSQYKHTTIQRRVRRRMALIGSGSFAQYIDLLEQRPAEVVALHNDFLIRVTSFFRDPAVFVALTTKVFPALVQERPPGTPLRLWIAGCSTGEEVYSIAIALLEFLGDMAGNTPIKILATDISEPALERARAGLYVDNIAMDVSPERLRRFFVQVNGNYQISKSVRDLCVFSKHNLAKDNPFANLDLITCRNVLIYMDAALQRRVMPLFHYALKSTGHLMLGTAETVGGFSALFEPVDQESRIYAKKATANRVALSFGSERPTGTAGPEVSAGAGDSSEGFDVQKETDRLILSRYSPAGLVIDESLTILQFRGDVGPYLNPASGTATFDALKMVRSGLAVTLRAAVTEVLTEGRTVRKNRIRLTEGERVRTLSLEVLPLRTPPRAARCCFVVFEDVDESRPILRPDIAPTSDEGTDAARIKHLEAELTATREYIQSLAEQNESATEELKSAHEEVLSSNEELQSTNEELQSSKEEMQSANEELATVNDELAHRNGELGRLNDDLVNLFGGLDIPVVMVSRDLRIRRFTPPAEGVFKLIPTDIGRPIGDLRPTLAVPDLGAVVTKVIRTLAVRELEVQDHEGRWFLLRVRPYVTSDNKIDGAALAVLDIDQMKRGAQQLQAARDYAEAIVEAVWQPLVVLDPDLKVKRANAAFYRVFSLSRERTEGRAFYDLEDGRWDHEKLRGSLSALLPAGGQVRDLEIEVDLPDLGRRTMLLNARRVEWEVGGSQMILLAIEDVTDRKKEAEHAQQLASEQAARVEAEAANRAKDEFLAMLAHELRNPLAPVRNTLSILRQRSRDDAVAERALEMSERQVGHMARLLDDLLDVSRITRGQIRLQKEIVDLSQLVRRTVEGCRHAIDSRGHTLSIKLPSDQVFVEADPARLEQVISNLLANAAKYTDPGGRISLEMIEDDGSVAVTVRDTGVGIAPEMIPRVFDLFAQADRSLDRSQGGLGIGLTLVKRLIELHGGTVSVESEGPGKGSEFAVWLPGLVRPTPGPKGAAKTVAADHPTHRILVVDDNQDSAESLAMALRLAGHEVQTAHDGRAALDVAARFRPAVVLLDIGLPGMSGYEVAHQLRENGLRDAVLIALTGYGRDEDRRLSREAGMHHHIVKPVDFGELERVLAALRP